MMWPLGWLLVPILGFGLGTFLGNCLTRLLLK